MHHFRTRAAHAWQKPDPVSGANATPISQITSFSYSSDASVAARSEKCRRRSATVLRHA